MSSEDRFDAIRASRIAARSPKLIASLVPGWERVFGGSVAAHLGADERSVARLSLCALPQPDRFGADVGEIAAACGIDEGRLASFLRQAASVERMGSAAPVGGVVDGRLMAARDRDEDPE